MYLEHKAESFLHAYLCDVCGVEREKDSAARAPANDRLEASYLWARVEFTETRGTPHYHVLVKLPWVLDTAVLGRMVQEGRLVREELKRGNIRNDKLEEAWRIVRMGQLADRYIVLFAESMSVAAYFDDDVPVDRYEEGKVVDLNKLRDEYLDAYKQGDISRNSHPIMREADSAECDSNR
jgi:hypothetical protein